MKVADVRSLVHQRCLDIRSIEHTVTSDSFEVAYDSATEEQKKEVQSAILNYRVDDLKKIVAKLSKGQEFSLRELRELASSERIKNYSQLAKGALLLELRKRKRL